MAPTVKWQRWDSSVYDYGDNTAAGPMAAIQTELDAWITACNGNASNTGRQLSRISNYDEGDGTSMGLVVQMNANNNTVNGYMSIITTTGSSRAWRVSRGWTDDTGNGGFGTPVTTVASDTSTSWANTGFDGDFLLVYDSTDGKEFFCMTQRIGTDTNRQDGWLIFKNTLGEWSSSFNDSGTGYCGYYDASEDRWQNVGNNSSTGYSTVIDGGSYNVVKLSYYAGLTSGPSYIGPNYIISAASDFLFGQTYSASNSNVGNRYILTGLGDGTNVYMLCLSYQTVTCLIDLRS